MTIHKLEQGADAPSGAAEGDVVLRPQGDDVEVARVTAAGPEWLGSVPASTLDLSQDDAALEIAVRGVESALVERGG
ncbi:MAG: hypothetical protein JWO60_3367 [Frankiales bacterium]|nr:hypothetical protein [Frankiales bacterium]